MFDRIRQLGLRLLRVPPDPDPPAGAPGSLLVFRAGRKFYHLRLARWTLGQLGALAGIVFSLFLLTEVERAVESNRTATPPAAAAETTARDPERAAPRSRADRERSLVRIARHSPPWIWPVIRFFEFAGIVLYLVQIPITYAMVRLDYALRWYMATDRSLRIRSGLATVQETTMSFANIQQVVVTQGPLQRLLGLADVHVQSAGGGGGGTAKEENMSDSLHTGVFQGVENAAEIRDLILERLRRYREAGLGDPDETAPAPVPGPDAAAAMGDSGLVHAAAREMLAEARALRASLPR